MSLTKYEEVKCPCGEVFTAELYSSVNAQLDAELKELIYAGELNVVKCPKCSEMFYAEHFVLYLDPPEELFVFVYPAACSEEKEYWQAKMMEDFSKAQQELAQGEKISYSPMLLFGMDELLGLLKYEELLKDEESIVGSIGSDLKMKLLKLNRSTARKEKIPFLLAYIDRKDFTLRENVIEGLKKLLKVMPDLVTYQEALKKIENDSMFFENKKVEFIE